jgi:hypothetical protein
MNIPDTVFTAFVNRVERDYCHNPAQPNPYHTNVHAADVVQVRTARFSVLIARARFACVCLHTRVSARVLCVFCGCACVHELASTSSLHL